jgi:hypothetical protein
MPWVVARNGCYLFDDFCEPFFIKENIMSEESTPIEFDMTAFKTKADDISIVKISQEALQWMVKHVEDYIDNQQIVYRLYFVKDSFDELPEMSRLYNLYHEIPEVAQDHPQEELVISALQYLHAITGQVKDVMNSNKDLCTQLFKRLIFYYDTKIQKHGENFVPVIYDLDGHVHINLFDYQAMSVDLEIRKREQSTDALGEAVKKISLPEGYEIEFTLHYWPAVMSTSVGTL